MKFRKNKNITKTAFLFIILSLNPVFAGGVSEEEKYVCLTLIVKNEEAVIERCLNSVKDIVDCVSVVDVGSTDKTKEIINGFFKKNSIPGKIYSSEWKNFGFNRTESLHFAEQTLVELGLPVQHSYFLILDADMEVQIDSSFDTDTLSDDTYLLPEESSFYSCYTYNPRLLHASLPWECTGELHETWSSKDAKKNTKLNTLLVKDHANGDSTSIKRSLEHLTQAFVNGPGNPKNIFSLAQVHRSLKNYEEAIEFYKARVQKEGEKEEIWFSKFMIGECFEKLGKWDQALSWYLDAYQFDPKRSEPLLKVTSHYRHSGKNDLACIFAKYGLHVPHNGNYNLSVYSPLTDYQFDEELSIAAYYTPFREEGFAAASDLLIRKNVPWQTINQTYNNILYYVKNLEKVRFSPIEFDFPIIQKGFAERYHPMNPSLKITADGYDVVCRTVNYTQKGAKIFNTIDLSGVFRTRNFLLHYDKSFNLLTKREIIENLPRETLQSCNVVGLEDCRIFEYNNSSWFTCTTSDTNPTGQRQISLCKLPGNSASNDVIEVEELIPLLGPDLNRCEKNWMPFNKDGSLYMIYSCDPFLVFTPDFETGECRTVVNHRSPSFDYSRFRGSAAPIPFDRGYLMMIHEVFYLPEFERCYLHRFVYMDENFITKKVSKPFTFKHFGIEFCCSMTLNHAGTDLIMAVGIEDREAYLCSLDVDSVRAALDPLPLIHETAPQ